MTTVEKTRLELREIPLTQITVAQGFNPRGEVSEDADLRALAETIRQRGCLMPVRVRAAETGGYVLIAGERRYRAAALAGLDEIPATVVAPGDGDEDEQRELLTDAIVENEVRRDLDPLQRALGFKAMLDAGLTVRGVADRLGGSAGRRAREQRIREHLAVLELPEGLRASVARGEIPLLAVKALVGLAKIHEDLAQAAVAAVTADEETGEPYTWQEVASEPLAVAVNNLDELPLGLFSTARSHPLERFTLSEKARKDLGAYERLVGRPLTAVRFTAELLERPRALGAVHDCGWFAVVAGQEVADSLAEDYVASTLRQERAWRRQKRDQAGSEGPAAAVGRGADGEPLVASEQDDEARRAEAAAQREADRERREAAIRFNVELGLLTFKHLTKIKPDERVLRILASVDLGGCLRQIALTGARLCLPGWVTEGTRSNGTLKADYLEDNEVLTKATVFLDGVESASDVAGRAIVLIALAELADQEAIAQSRRCFYGLAFRGPWAEQAKADLLAIVRERIKGGQLPALDELLTDRSEKAAVAPETARS
jgi:ParB/RepB/Spo0J family partition protein